MRSEVMFAGFGGQGILLMGKILAHAAMTKGLDVVWSPSYGAEMRGGTAYCTVIISDKTIGAPVVRNPAHLVAMNRPSLEKFSPFVKSNGVVLINSSLISIDSGRDDVVEIKIPVNDIASDVGSVKAANIVALAAFVAISNIIDFEAIRESVKQEFIDANKEKLIPLNMKALDQGKKNAINNKPDNVNIK